MQIIIFSLIPAILYLFLMYVTTPYNTWSFNRAMYYLCIGTIAIPIVLAIHRFFPWWNELYTHPSDDLAKLLVLAFIQIALLEESIKFLAFKLFYGLRQKFRKTELHPLAIMVYCGATALGFAFVENIAYANRAIDMASSMNILYWRAISAVILHMVCGLMIGYWISLSRFDFQIKSNPINTVRGISIFDLFIRRKWFRKIFYTIVGISMAIFIHGIYDYNLLGLEFFNGTFSDGNIAFTIQMLILALSLYITKKMANHLVILTNKQRKKIGNKN